MPFGNARSLSNDDVYALTAYLLYLNDIVTDEDFELSKENFASIRLPNEANFIADDRAAEPHNKPGAEPCMTNCKPDPAKVKMRARILDVTPDVSDDDAENLGGRIGGLTGMDPRRDQPSAFVNPALPQALLAALFLGAGVTARRRPPEAGEALFKPCATCHEIGEGARHKVGPASGRADRTHCRGGRRDFKFSEAMHKAGLGGLALGCADAGRLS